MVDAIIVKSCDVGLSREAKSMLDMYDSSMLG